MESYQRSVDEWVLYEVVLSFVIRVGYRVPLLSNPWIWAAAALAIALQGLLMYTPLATVFSIVPLGAAELGPLLLAGALFALAALGYQKLAHSTTTRDRG